MQVQVKDFADTEMLSPYAGRARIPDHRDKIFKDGYAPGRRNDA